MKIFYLLLLGVFTISFTTTSTIDFQSDPKLVLEEIFRAAAEQDFVNLSKLCPPDGSNDGDTQQYICEVASADKKTQNEFVNYFKDGKITGEIVYTKTSNGLEMAAVPFWFNHPSGESRSNETMNLVKVDKKWYLQSF